jgi:uncharacterized protein YeaO (DUF488 family)
MTPPSTCALTPSGLMTRPQWPRVIAKESLHFSDWLNDVAPSEALRRGFQHEVPEWAELQRGYRKELDERPDTWAPIVAAARRRHRSVVQLARHRATQRGGAA